MALSRAYNALLASALAATLGACATPNVKVGQPREIFNANDCTLTRYTDVTTTTKEGEQEKAKTETRADYVGRNGECVRDNAAVNIAVTAITGMLTGNQPAEAGRIAEDLIVRLRAASATERAHIENQMAAQGLTVDAVLKLNAISLVKGYKEANVPVVREAARQDIVEFTLMREFGNRPRVIMNETLIENGIAAGLNGIAPQNDPWVCIQETCGRASSFTPAQLEQQPAPDGP